MTSAPRASILKAPAHEIAKSLINKAARKIQQGQKKPLEAHNKEKDSAYVRPTIEFADIANKQLNTVFKDLVPEEVPEQQQLRVLALEKGATIYFDKSESTVNSFSPLQVDQTAQVPSLAHRLSRVLFSPGVHYLRDPRTGVYNFSPHLHKPMSVDEFDFDTIPEYITSSRDSALLKLAGQEKCEYFGSTSTMTSVLSQFHFLLSNFRPINHSGFSMAFASMPKDFTIASRMTASVIVRRHKAPHSNTAIYSIDNDRSNDKEIILGKLGHVLERFLTKPLVEFEKHRKVPNITKTVDEGEESSYYNYSRIGNFLMRSQLDAKDHRLPGTGAFDLKTRAVGAIRYDLKRTSVENTGYQLVRNTGLFESFERELFDLTRATMLKYSLQARIGRMDGVFVAYHNIQEIFGFQYLPLTEMDFYLHSSKGTRNREPAFDLDDQYKLVSKLANDEFVISVKIWEQLLKVFRNAFNGESFRMIFKAAHDPETKEAVLNVIGQPLSNNDIQNVQKFGPKLDNKLSKLLYSKDVSSEREKQLIKSHVTEIRNFNDKLANTNTPVGFRLYVKHSINGKKIKLEDDHQYLSFKKPTDLWQVDSKVKKLDAQTARDLYKTYLDEKLKFLTLETQNKVSEFVQDLRKFGDIGEKRSKLMEKLHKEVVWNTD